MDGVSPAEPSRRPGLAWLVRAKVLLVNGVVAYAAVVALLTHGFRWWILGCALAISMSGLLVWMCARMLVGGSELEAVLPRRTRQIIGVGHLAAAVAFGLSAITNQELVGSVAGGSWSVLMALFVLNMPALFAARPAA
jgi:hypothetical protein